ncbi:MAG: hypothetical protein SRB1_00630 [Desulfobacteraceae bacterium Eth-SRB1]|nr:MAG: hypothetical protein SRB1_00630 [Desulfobacteraceae bacterium Eth-SRB1]
METTNEMPALNIGEKTNPIQAVQNHLEAVHGKLKAAQKLKAMSGADLIGLADDIASGKADSNSEINEMPSMIFKRRK